MRYYRISPEFGHFISEIIRGGLDTMKMTRNKRKIVFNMKIYDLKLGVISGGSLDESLLRRMCFE